MLYLNALPSAVLAVDRTLAVQFINPAGEALLAVSASQAVGRMLSDMQGLPEEIHALCERVFASGEAISLYGQTLKLPFHYISVTLHITPVLAQGAHEAAQALIVIEKTEGIDRHTASEWKQDATRAAGVMAAMLAHEVKNPLSGIRGAAQLLGAEVGAEHRQLTELICMETDRIRDLLDQVEVFSASAPGDMRPVNVHEALRYAMQVASSGFARHVTFREQYDPSLPEVIGRRDLLVQLFLNLIKNAAEALVEVKDATIVLSTAYRSGYRVRSKIPLPLREGLGEGEMGQYSILPPPPQPSPARGEGVSLSVMIAIEDNGPGIAQDIRAHLFEPFVSSKEEGRGLGLAIVAKIASDLGAVVELDEECASGTRFAVWLPSVKFPLPLAGEG